MTDLRYEKMTYELRGVLFEAHNQLRLGWPEEAYHRAVAQLLQDKGVPVQFKPRHPVVHRGSEVHIFECDLIAWDAIILELKVLPFATFAAAHYAQIIHYLKCWGKGLGLLVNFGKRRVEIERVIWDEPELTVDEKIRFNPAHPGRRRPIVPGGDTGQPGCNRATVRPRLSRNDVSQNGDH